MEIGRSLNSGARLLLFGEPTVNLTFAVGLPASLLGHVRGGLHYVARLVDVSGFRHLRV